MDAPLPNPSGPGRWLRCGALVLTLFALSAGLAPAAPTVSPAETANGPRMPPPARCPCVAALPVAKGFWAPIREALSNRTRMVQLATIGMLVGLFIMLRK